MAVEKKVCQAKAALAIIYPQASDNNGGAESTIRFVVEAKL